MPDNRAFGYARLGVAFRDFPGDALEVLFHLPEIAEQLACGRQDAGVTLVDLNRRERIYLARRPNAVDLGTNGSGFFFQLPNTLLGVAGRLLQQGLQLSEDAFKPRLRADEPRLS